METKLGELEERLVSSIFRTFPVAATDFWELASVTSDAAVKACDDDRKNLKLECPSTEETRDRVVAYLENIAKHKCSKQSKKEMDEKRILGRTRTVSIRSVSQVRVSH